MFLRSTFSQAKSWLPLYCLLCLPSCGQTSRPNLFPLGSPPNSHSISSSIARSTFKGAVPALHAVSVMAWKKNITTVSSPAFGFWWELTARRWGQGAHRGGSQHQQFQLCQLWVTCVCLLLPCPPCRTPPTAEDPSSATMATRGQIGARESHVTQLTRPVWRTETGFLVNGWKGRKKQLEEWVEKGHLGRWRASSHMPTTDHVTCRISVGSHPTHSQRWGFFSSLPHLPCLSLPPASLGNLLFRGRNVSRSFNTTSYSPVIHTPRWAETFLLFLASDICSACYMCSTPDRWWAGENSGWVSTRQWAWRKLALYIHIPRDREQLGSWPGEMG